MANRIIFTTPVRCSYPHLDKPHAQQGSTDAPKYSVSMMAPMSGICPLNNQPSSFANIRQALDEVCMEEWNMTFQQATAPGMGINYPPNFKNGNTVFEKDKAGNPIPNQVNPFTANMEILTVKNLDPVGCVDPSSEIDINPASIYGGCWIACQLEVSAYTNTANLRVIAIKLLNVQMCYDDESFGGKAPVQSATQAFAGRAVTDSNVQAGFGQAGSFTPQTAQPNQAPQAAPQTPPAAAQPTLEMIATDFTLDQYKAQGWTEEMLVQHGKARMVTPAAPQTPPAAPNANQAPQAPATPQAAPAAPQTPPQAQTPSAPPQASAPPATPSAPPQAAPADPVIMNAGEAPYADYVALGWTDEMLIQHGKAKPNYLNPQAA